MGKRIQRVDIDKMATKLLELGYQEENIHTEVQIDCTGVLWDYPDATVEMSVQAPNGEKYPVVPELANNVVIWDVTDSDLVYPGSGKIQLTLKNGNEVIKSASCSTRIMESITATGSAPTPLENWMQQAEETAHQIALTAKDEVIEQIQDAADEARKSIPADYTQLSDDVTGLKSAIDDIFDKETVPASIDEITGIVKRAGFSGGAQTSGRIGIKLTQNSNYDSYYIITNKPVAVAFNNPTVAYLAVCVVENYTGIETDPSNNLYLCGDNPQRYRKSDGTLPTLNNPLNVPAGAAISFSITAGKTATVYGLEEKNAVKEEFANTIGEIIGAVRPTIKYLSTVDTDIGSRGKEQLSIFLPTHNGFIKYAFVRCEYDSYNANNWRIDKCYACDNAKNVLYPITASGEWEMAIKINGAPDFIGGNAHGDEVLTAFNVFIDGVLIADVSTITEQQFDVVKIIETSLLYNPNDGATLSTRGQYTPIGTHGREYAITRDGIKLKQEVTFDTALTLAASYMTMLPIIRGNDTVSALQITDHYYGDNNYTVYDVSVGESGSPGYGWKYDVEQATIWGNDSGINATVKMLKQPMIDNIGARRFQVQDTLNAYNKLYWSVCGVGGNNYDVSQNERFVTESLYMINRR